MPDIPQSAKANLALWRIGGISVPIHSAYGEKQLIRAINDLKPALIITASCYVEGEDIKPLKKIVDNARAASNFPKTKTLLIQRKFHPETENINREIDFEYDEEVEKINGTVDPVVLPSNHPSYIYWHRQ
jgi:propionyl-CoA synthetase